MVGRRPHKGARLRELQPPPVDAKGGAMGTAPVVVFERDVQGVPGHHGHGAILRLLARLVIEGEICRGDVYLTCPLFFILGKRNGTGVLLNSV